MKTGTGAAGRQEAILRIVATRVVRTQAELQKLLAAAGHAADQATLSRDVRKLGLVKVAGADGEGAHYARVDGASAPASDDAVAVVARFVKDVDWSGNLVVVQTAPGNASPLGIALDRLGWKEIVGTVAGDDTLLIVVREGARARQVAGRIRALQGGTHS